MGKFTDDAGNVQTAQDVITHGSGGGGGGGGTVNIDQSTPGTTNGVQVNAALPTGANTIGNVGLAAGAALVGKVGIDQTTPGTTNAVSATNFPAVAALGHGTAATALRVELPTDGTGVVGLAAGATVGLAAGSALFGKAAIDQSTPGTSNRVAANLDQVAGATVAQGHGTAATALRVELPTDGTGVVGLAAGSATIGSIAPAQGTWTDRSGTVATGGTSQTLAASNGSRKRIMIQNPPSATESLFINWTTAASTTVGSSIEISPGGAYDSESGPVSTEAITVTAATTGHKFAAKEM